MDERSFLKRKIFLKKQAVLILREEIRNLQAQVVGSKLRKNILKDADSGSER